MSAIATDVDREMEHESEFLSIGTAKYRNRVINNRTKGVESRSDYGKRLISRCVEPLSKAITAFLLDATTRGAGRRHLAANLLPNIKPDVAAFIAAREIIAGISLSARYQTTARKIGEAIEEEIRFTHFKKTNKVEFLRAERNFETNPVMAASREKRAGMLTKQMKKIGILMDRWPLQQRFHVGSKLVDLFIEATGLASLYRSTDRRDTNIFIQPTPQLMEWITQFTGHSELMCPDLQPCLIPPRQWFGMGDGGYHHERIRSQQRLVRIKSNISRGSLSELEAAQMPEVYAAVNALQETAWKINQPMLDFVEEVWNSGLEVAGIPSQFDEQLATQPERNSANPDTRKAWSEWKFKSADVYRRNVARKSKRMALARVLHLATKFKDEPVMYYPIRLDFRGRAYYVPPALNPQGSDLAKSLLTFVDGKPLGERGAYWLAVAISNHFGNDKVSLDDRADWTRQNSNRIVSMANDPMNNLWWTEADKPFQFLAACIEWVGYTTDGPEYVCSLPVLVDGSCNGLQHFSAMLRDEVCGKHVNLVPAEKPGDVYSEVAKALMALLERDVKENPEKAEWAADWLAFGIDRKLCKRPTMVLPYGGTRDAFARYVIEYVREKGHKFGKLLAKRCFYLVKLMIEAMDATIIGPRKAMAWLREVASIAAKEGLPLVWTAPTGFVVFQSYLSMRGRRVQTKVGDSIIKFTLEEETEKIDRMKQMSALSPNFVHSLDAAALMQTVNLCRDRGILSFHAVHDSYGTLPADMDTLDRALREVFVSLYHEDLLMKFRDEIQGVTETKLPELPSKGSLSLASVLQSRYFFA